MTAYVLYIHDDRYSVPSLDSITADTDERARKMADDRLASSPHYHRIELWDDDRRVADLEKPAGKPA